MAATEAPQHATALRSRVEQIRGSIATLDTEITRAKEKAAAAEANGDFEASLKARTRLVALKSALGDARLRQDCLGAELAAAEAAERREEALKQMGEAAPAHRAEMDKAIAEANPGQRELPGRCGSTPPAPDALRAEWGRAPTRARRRGGLLLRG